MANLATKAGVEGRQHLKIHTPLIAMTKAQIIAKGMELGVDYGADQQLLRSFAGGRTVRRSATPAYCGRRDFARTGSRIRC